MIGYRQAVLLSLAGDTTAPMSAAVPIHPDRLCPIILRDYQLDILQRVAAAMRAGHRRVLVVLPTGGGKTVLASQALLCALHLGATGQFLVHRKELLDQTSLSFLRAGLDHGFIAAGRRLSYRDPITLAGAQTLANRLDMFLPPNLLIADEAHHSPATTFARIFDAYPDSFIMGLTATPQRLDGRGLDEQFDVIVEGPTVAALMARGFLSPYDYYAPSLPDMTGVRTDQQAEAVMDTPDLIGDMVSHYQRLAAGQPGILFAHSIAHSRHLVDAFQAEGVRIAHMDGDMSDKERERVDASFRARDVDLLSNVALLGEGYDVPGVVYLGMGRRTQSLSWFRQMAGRALRPIYADGWAAETDAERLAAIAAGPKPRAIICDHAGNAFNRGLPDDDIIWSLEGRAKGVGACNADAEPVRQCLTCYRVYPSILAGCPGCGAVRTPTAREIRVKEGELAKLDREARAAEKAREAEARAAAKAEREAERRRAAAVRKAEEKACACYADFHDLAVARGYETPAKWAAMRVSLKNTYGARFR